MIQKIALGFTVLDLAGLLLIGYFFLRNGLRKPVDRTMFSLVAILLVAFAVVFTVDIITISGHSSPLGDSLKILRPILVRGVVAIPIWAYVWKCYRG